jgi:hypothetical protein
MKTRLSQIKWRINWIALILVSFSIYQLFLVTNEYALVWVKRTWKNKALSAMERSALFHLGGTGASFMEFIAETVPEDKSIIVPERSAAFSQQSTLTYFLMPRKIITCSCDTLGGKCYLCLRNPDVYVPVTRNFPDPEALNTVKKFLPFPGESDYYLGVYAPPDARSASRSSLQGIPYTPLRALCIDLLTLGGMGLLGFLVVFPILSQPDQLEALSLSIPVGMGLLTWVLFIISWAGVPLVLPSVVITYLALLCPALFGYWFMRKSRIRGTSDTRAASFISRNTRLFSGPKLQTVGWMSILLLFGVVTFISVGRSYSTFDDIAIWALKGYGIAYEGTIFAQEKLGGHGLSYPLNIPLAVTTFKLASGDVLPGSKLIFPILSGALLFGSFRFWQRRKVNEITALGGVLLLLTVPQIFTHTTLGFANMPFTTYLVLGVLWSIEGLTGKSPGSLLLGGLLLALAGWTRPEGFLFALLLIGGLCVGSFKNMPKRIHLVFWFLPVLVIPGVWLIFGNSYIKSDQIGGALTAFGQQLLRGHLNLTHLISIASFGIKQILTPKIWGCVFPLSFLLIIGSIRRGYPLIAFPLILATLAAILTPVGLFFIEAANEGDFNTFLNVSFDRAFFPAAFLIAILAIMVWGTRKPTTQS